MWLKLVTINNVDCCTISNLNRIETKLNKLLMARKLCSHEYNFLYHYKSVENLDHNSFCVCFPIYTFIYEVHKNEI
jgi:hypothetical protein